MFEPQKPRYLTKGIDAEILLALQLFLWNCVDTMPEPKDYLQVFDLKNENGLQHIIHRAEQPEYQMKYFLPAIAAPVTAKVYIIDDGDHCTMLPAEEY